MSKYQALIDALKAGPTDGPWFEHHDKGHLYIENYRDDVVCDIGRGAKSCPTSKYIAAADPATIRSLLADLERAEKAIEAIVNSAEAGNAAIIEHLLADARASLSQLKGVQ